MLMKTLVTAVLVAAALLTATAPALADPDETRASDCRSSGDEFQAEWEAAWLDD